MFHSTTSVHRVAWSRPLLAKPNGYMHHRTRAAEWSCTVISAFISCALLVKNAKFCWLVLSIIGQKTVPAA